MFNGAVAPAFILAAVLFALTFGAGIVFATADPDTGEEVLTLAREQVLSKVIGEEGLELFVRIFMNNAEASLLLFLGGASLGLLTAIIIIFNGMLTGVILELIRVREGMLFVSAAILPHGIFEIPAFLLAGALGFLLGEAMVREWNGEGGASERAAAYGRSFIRFVIPLLVVAAFVEAFITPEILKLLL